MAPIKCKGTPLKVFSGKEATLNRVIMLILRSSKQPLSKYDVYLMIHGMKGLRHTTSKTVYRRIDALIWREWIIPEGKRPAKVQGDSILYGIALKGKAALLLDEINIDVFLETASEKQLTKLLDAL